MKALIALLLALVYPAVSCAGSRFLTPNQYQSLIESGCYEGAEGGIRGFVFVPGQMRIKVMEIQNLSNGVSPGIYKTPKSSRDSVGAYWRLNGWVVSGYDRFLGSNEEGEDLLARLGFVEKSTKEGANVERPGQRDLDRSSWILFKAFRLALVELIEDPELEQIPSVDFMLFVYDEIVATTLLWEDRGPEDLPFSGILLKGGQENWERLVRKIKKEFSIRVNEQEWLALSQTYIYHVLLDAGLIRMEGEGDFELKGFRMLL